MYIFSRRLWVACACAIFAVSATDVDEPWDEDDFYSLLNVSQESNLAAIKRAYRKMSLEHHPDTPGSTDGVMFQKISRAYEVLSSEKLRRIYDQKGIEGVEEHEKLAASGGQRMQDPFAAMFGFGQQHQAEPKRASIEIPLFVSLKDLYLGKTLEASVFKQTRCKKCRGTGAKTKKDIHTCPHCKGQGVVVGVHHIGGGMYQQVRQACPHCSGKGKTIGRTCPHCAGKKVADGHEHAHLHIERGMPQDHLIVLESMCDEVAGSTDAPGDVRFRVQAAETTLGVERTLANGTEVVEPHKVVRSGKNLQVEINLSLKEALTGFTRTVRHLDNHPVEVDRSGLVTSHETTEKIAGEGMPVHERPSEFGHLLLQYNVLFPETLTKEQKDVIEKIF